MRYLKENTATRVTVGPFLDVTDAITPEIALTVTACHLTFMVDDAGTPTLVIDAAPTASGGSNDMVHVTSDIAGFYDLELTAAQTNYTGRAMLMIHDTDVHLPVFHEFQIVSANVYDSLFTDGDVLDVNVTQWLGTAAATPTTAGVPEVDVTFVSGTAQTANDIGADVNEILTDTGTTIPATIATAQADLDTITGAAGVVLDAGAITNASLAGNMEIVFETDFSTNYNTTRNAWATNAQDIVGTSASDPFNGQVVAASVTGAVGSVTGAVGSVTGAVASVTGAVGSVTGAVGSVAGNVDGNVTGSVGSNLELGPAEVNTEVDNAMVTYGLDHLMSASVTGTDVTDNSVIAKIVSASATADWDDFVNTTDSLQAVRDHIGDGTNLTETGGDGDHLTEAGGTGDHLTALDVYSIAGNAQAATNLSASARSMQILTVNTGNVAATTQSAQFTGVTEATADHFIGRKLFFYDSGDALFLQGTSITDSSWDAAYTEVVLTFQQLTDTPADGDVAILV